MTNLPVITRNTVCNDASRKGPSLLTGQECAATIRPAEAGAGISFLHLPTRTLIPASLDHVADTPHCTALQMGEARIDFSEHLLAALFAGGITDAVVEVDGGEVPLLDGSASEYAKMVAEAGIASLGAEIEPIVITSEVLVAGPNKMISAVPGGPQYWYLLDHSHRRIGRQAASFDPLKDCFATQVAPARTFSTEEEARALIEARGLEGADVGMSLIVFQDRLSAPEPFANSFAMHKVIDLIGDLYLLGRPVIGRVIAHRTGHADNRALARKIAESHAP